jgi:predicted acylesterase/phospholipase RssA
MKPTSLLAKTAGGLIVPFHGGGGGADGPGVQYMDGSFTADIPRDRLTELFHVTQTVVSQVGGGRRDEGGGGDGGRKVAMDGVGTGLLMCRQSSRREDAGRGGGGVGGGKWKLS